jgi:uncharacterized delta-60 repeat protein
MKNILRALLLVLALTATASAAVGDLDPTFGTNGIANTGFGLDGVDYASALAIQPDGKIVAVGWYYNADLTICFGSRGYFAAARLNENGTLDSTFGTGGKVSTNFGGYNVAQATALQPDGKIIVAGNVQYCGNTSAAALARYDSTGALDAAFGSAGKVTTDFNAGNTGYQEVNTIAIQSDGKILAGGFAQAGWQQGGAWWLARYNSNGTLDNTFGTGGIVRTAFVNMYDEHVTAIVIQPDGKIVATGYTLNVGIETYPTLILARYNTDGTLDTSFGQSGKVLGDRNHGGGYALIRQSDGRLVVATNVNNFTGNSLVGRYDSNGTIDAAFGSGGWTTTALYCAYGIAIQPDGRIVAAGCDASGVALFRLNPNGVADTSFGSNGKVAHTYADTAKGVAIQSDYKIVVTAGVDCCGFVAARYLSLFNVFFPIIKKNSP